MNKNIIKMNYPASWWGAKWREALPSGNGEVGIAVYGAIHEETVMLNHANLWWKTSTPPMPDVSEKLGEVRRALFNKEVKKADSIIKDALIEKGYSPKLASPLPLGDMKIIMPLNNVFEKYERSLDMETGEIKVSWVDGSIEYKRSMFVSRADNIIVCKISANQKESVDADIYIDLHDRNDAMKYTSNLDEYLPKNVEFKTQNGIMYYAAKNDDGKDFGAVTRIITKKGSIDNSNDKVIIKAADEVLIITKLFVKGERNNSWENLLKQIVDIDDTYDDLLKRHEKLHKPIFEAMTINFYAKGNERTNEELLMDAYKGNMPMALLEKMWSYGRYLLISSSKKGGHPCHLYGLWCGEYQGMWAFNMLNENVQMTYWHALSGNMPKLLLALFDYYERMMDDFRENAKKLYNCRGIYIPAPTAPDSGLLKTLAPHIIHWTGAAGWLAEHYYDYYLYTGDIEFLKKRALPFMKEAALFYEDFFIKGKDGFFISCPSNSPENTPGNYWDGEGMGAQMETTINATMDFAIAKELLTNLIEGAKIVGVYKEDIDKWRGMLKCIPPYQINEDGAIKEWMHPYFLDNYHHRHESHLYPVFPGTEVTKENNPKLFKSFVEAVKKRLVVGLNEQSGWSLAHMANNYARMGEGDQALKCLEIISKSCVLNNLYTTHNDWRNMGVGVKLPWAPIQLDANMGLCSAVNEMLMFSIPGKISILPALPKKIKRGKVERMQARGGVEVSIKWDMNEGIIEVLLISKEDCVIEILLPEMVKKVEEYKIENRKIEDIKLKAQKELIINMKTK